MTDFRTARARADIDALPGEIEKMEDIVLEGKKGEISCGSHKGRNLIKFQGNIAIHG